MKLAEFVDMFYLPIDAFKVQEGSPVGPQSRFQNSERRFSKDSISIARSCRGKYYIMYEDEVSESAWADGTGSKFRGYSKATIESQLPRQLLDTMTRTMAESTLEAGYIYAFRRPGTRGFLKIGFTKDTAQRLSRWESKCGRDIELVFEMYIPQAVGRIERLVHKTLETYRRLEYCSTCAGKGRITGVHNEWFEVSENMACDVVDLWRMFSRQKPYDCFGRLKYYWSDFVARQRGRISEMNNLVTLLDGMPDAVVRGMLKPEAYQNIRSLHVNRNGDGAWLYLSLV
jgi:T5orf172 domain-containing protein